MNRPVPKSIERIVSILIPAACREEVLGDLYESCDSLRRFLTMAIQVFPMVLLSRMRRAADSQLLVIQAASLLMCFIGAAQLERETALFQGAGILRLAIPVSLILIGSLLEGAYALPGERSRLRMFAAPLLGLGWAYAAECVIALYGPQFMLPNPVLLYGGLGGGLFCAAVQLSFPVTLERGKQAVGPAFASSRTWAPARVLSQAITTLKLFATVVVLAWVAGRVGGNTAGIVMLVVAILVIIFRELSRTL